MILYDLKAFNNFIIILIADDDTATTTKFPPYLFLKKSTHNIINCYTLLKHSKLILNLKLPHSFYFLYSLYQFPLHLSKKISITKIQK
jgi:hypothetical protein